MAASTTILNLSDGTNSVDITFTKLEQDYLKDVIVIPHPQKGEARGVILTHIVDLQKLKEVITIMEGYLLEKTGNTALQKKTQLEALMSREGTMTAKWMIGTTTISKPVNILKCKIREMPFRYGNEHPITQGKGLKITIQLIVGTHK